MKKNKKLPCYAFLLVLLMACNLVQPSHLTSKNIFPLQKKWALPLTSDVHTLAVSGSWLVAGTQSGLTAIDTDTEKILWTKELNLDTDSELIISNEILIANNSNNIKLIEKSGREIGVINLDSKEGSANIIAAVSHYVFAIRRPAWILEVYDTKTMSLAWDVSIDRGGINIHYDNSTNIGYMTTSGDIRAIDLSTGNILWSVPKKVITSVYESKVLYYYGYSDDEKSRFVAAYNVDKETEIWETKLQDQIAAEVFHLTILNNVLIATTQSGIIAFDKIDGHKLWQAENGEQFFAKPIQLDNTIYINGSGSKAIYAIAPDSGLTIGRLLYDSPTKFLQPYSEYTASVYDSGHKIIFFNADTIYEYGK